MKNIIVSLEIQDLFICPCCQNNLIKVNNQLVCSNQKCATIFPIHNGIPIIINEELSVFSIKDYLLEDVSNNDLSYKKQLKNIINRLIPTISKNITGARNYAHFENLILKKNNKPRVLVLGGRILGQGMESLVNNPNIEVVETDVSYGVRTQLICDAHNIPFKDESFDGIIIQAVLEHVVDPYQCCKEIHRVLNKHGIVYAETPFIQQVHGGRYDFTRFTHLGHRRLFRNFEEIKSGAVCGPGMSFAWSYQYFLTSFSKSKLIRKLLEIFARFTSFYLVYLDYYLINKPGTLDAASGYYFLGTKSSQTLSDKDLIKSFKGFE